LDFPDFILTLMRTSLAVFFTMYICSLLLIACSKAARECGNRLDQTYLLPTSYFGIEVKNHEHYPGGGKRTFRLNDTY
jgi:hypothetical protein